MRRPPTALLLLAPFLLALLYAWIHHLAAPEPTVETVVPGQAIYVQRYRDIEALDQTFFRHPDDPTSPAEQISSNLNIAGFPGLDRTRPVHLVFLPRGPMPDTTMFILPIVREEALRARFEDPSFFLERGHVRHAKHLAVRGDFAAIGGDPDGVEHLGEGGLSAASLGETFMIAVDVPGMVDYAAQTSFEAPWRQVLEALGVGPDDLRMVNGVAVLTSDRVARIRAGWRTARLWAFVEERRIRCELEPTPGPLAAALARFAEQAPAGTSSVPPHPQRAQAWLQVPGAAQRAILVRALHEAGVRLPEGVAVAAGETGPWADASAGDGLLVWASAAPGAGYAWTLGCAAPRGSGLDFAPFLPGGPTLRDATGALGATLDFEEGALPLTVADLTLKRVAPAGRLEAWSTPELDIVVVGPAPDAARADFERGLAEPSRASAVAAPAPPWRVVLRFGLDAARARTLLGNEIRTGGLLAALAGGDIEGVVTTDGRMLRLDAQVVSQGP